MKTSGKIFLVLVVLMTLLAFVTCSKQPTTLNALFMKQAGYSEDDIKAGTA